MTVLYEAKRRQTKARTLTRGLFARLAGLASSLVTRAIEEGAQAFADENPDLVDGFVWHVNHFSPDICGTCMAKDKRWYPLGSYHKRPPQHPHCILPGQEVMIPGIIEATAKSFYNGRCVEITVADNRRLTVTHNHPILTPHGWVAAKDIHEGNDILVATDAQGIILAVNPNDEQIPALIEDVVGTFNESFAVATACMPVTAEDFHGDGRFIDGKVNVVYTDRSLLDNRNTVTAQAVGKIGFNRRNETQCALSANRVVDLVLQGAGVSADSSMGSSSIGLLDRIGRMGVPVGNSLFQCARNNTVSAEMLGECSVIDANLLRQFVDRFSSKMARSKVVQVRDFEFSGHVYDLQVSPYGLYTINGCIVKNCYCYSVSQSRSLFDMDMQPTDSVPRVRPYGEWALDAGVGYDGGLGVIKPRTRSKWRAKVPHEHKTQLPPEVPRSLIGKAQRAARDLTRKAAGMQKLRKRRAPKGWATEPRWGQESIAKIRARDLVKQQLKPLREHYPGGHDHDQMKHGRRGGAVSGDNAITPPTSLHEEPFVNGNAAEQFSMLPVSRDDLIMAGSKGWSSSEKGTTLELITPSEAKIIAMKRLDKRLKDDDDYQAFVKDFAKENELAQELMQKNGYTESEATTAVLIHTWAETSADKSPMSLWMQRAAAAEFGLESDGGLSNRTDAKLQGDIEKGFGYFEKPFRSFLRAQYNETQEVLKAAGIKEFQAFRGLNFDSKGELPAGIKPGGGVHGITMQPMSSFSIRHSNAYQFMGWESGAILVANIPASRVLSIPLTGFGCLQEHEIVVLGTGGKAWTYSWISHAGREAGTGFETIKYLLAKGKK